MEIEVKVNKPVDDREIYTYSQMRKNPGVYKLASGALDYCYLVSIDDTVLFFNTHCDSFKIAPYKVWKNQKFVKSNVKLTITLGN